MFIVNNIMLIDTLHTHKQTNKHHNRNNTQEGTNIYDYHVFGLGKKHNGDTFLKITSDRIYCSWVMDIDLADIFNIYEIPSKIPP